MRKTITFWNGIDLNPVLRLMDNHRETMRKYISGYTSTHDEAYLVFAFNIGEQMDGIDAVFDAIFGVHGLELCFGVDKKYEIVKYGDEEAVSRHDVPDV